MILSVRVDNYMFYSDGIELQLVPREDVRRFEDNVLHVGDFEALKSVCLYAPNNSGKTTLVRVIKYIRAVLLNETASLRYDTFYNFFAGHGTERFCNDYTGSTVSSFGVSFVQDGRAFSYDFRYDCETSDGVARGFVYECLRELLPGKDGTKIDRVIFLRDTAGGTYDFYGDSESKTVKEMKSELERLSGDNIFVYSVRCDTYPQVLEYRNILREFAKSVEIVDSNNVPIDKTVCALRDGGPASDGIVELIKAADLDIDDFYYEDPEAYGGAGATVQQNMGAKARSANRQSSADGRGLVSVHRGRKVLSVVRDSVGTCKMVALASYIVEALQCGKTLVVDELDSGLHSKLTRAVVLLFNNIANGKGQLIFNTHDEALLDCKKIFRQDQIWFTGRDREDGGEYFYSLADDGYTDSMVLEGADLCDMYRWGDIGVCPEPDLLSVILPKKEGGRPELKNPACGYARFL